MAAKLPRNLFKAVMENIYLPKEAYTKIRQSLVQFFKEQHKRFKNLSLELKENTLRVSTKSDTETTAVIRIVGELHKAAQLSVGVTKITVFQNNKEVFFVGLELKSSEIAISRNTMATSVLEKAIQSQSQPDPDSLQSLSEIVQISGIQLETVEEYLLSADGTGRKINVFVMKEDKVIPTKQIQPLLQGYFNWLSTSQLQEAMAALGEANILSSPSAANGKAPAATEQASAKPSKSRSTASAEEKQGRSPYKIPADFKPKTSYQKTLEAILEHQGNKAEELLAKLGSDDPTAIKFMTRVSKKYQKPEAAFKNLVLLAKDKLQGLETETSNSAD
ncbi:hypothetical protein COO91_02037 [Nostoc flagelliforme CCNUN1]|uniref:Uncharacterized protein n=1 Tax=Nostoc flagelliforme CCNUN1 TaxID=2038116 RepID=A0A2K8SKX6_9NOSO|nr:hypothetical protein COO91_02037 [Nostoc flagelliforme CCNUN1]